MTSQEREFLQKCKDDPVFFCEKVLGVFPWEKQKEILYSIRDNPNTITVSCNAGGKSFISAAAVLWFLCTKKDSIVLTSAPTWRQVTSVLWAEIENMYNNAKYPIGGELTTGKLQLGPKWFALGLPSSEEVRFQGYHAEDLLIVFDEAAGIEPHIYTAAQGNLTSKNSRLLLIGNPTSPTGMFYEYSKNPNWHRIHISAFDSPAIGEPEKYPYLVNQKWILERETEWGKTSPMYISRVLGEFPLESDDTLIPLSWLDAAVKRYMERSGKDLLVSEHVYVGTDVARMGGDKTVCASYQPNKVMPLKKAIGKDLPTVKHLVQGEAMAAGTKLMQITIDATGLGGGPAGDLRVMGYPVLEVNFAQKSNNKRFFKRLKDEIAWNFREVMRAGEIALPPDDELISQCSSVKYTIEQATGMIEIEDKEAMKKRGLKSPDCFWAVALALWGSKRIRVNPSIRPIAYRDQGDRQQHNTKWY
jgi:predicted nucleic acid-binding Zn ribbon protein